MEQQVKVYGTDWCEDTQRTLDHLDKLGVDYQYVDIETDEHAAAWIRQRNDGKERKPTIEVDGEVLTEPSDAELDEVLKKRKLV
jgi:mycoredoxin